MEAVTNTDVDTSKFVRCSNCAKCCPRAIKRFLVRNMVEQASIRDVQEACVYAHVVRVRSRTDRRNRDPPQSFKRMEDNQKPGQAPGAHPAGGAPAATRA